MDGLVQGCSPTAVAQRQAVVSSHRLAVYPGQRPRLKATRFVDIRLRNGMGSFRGQRAGFTPACRGSVRRKRLTIEIRMRRMSSGKGRNILMDRVVVCLGFPGLWSEGQDYGHCWVQCWHLLRSFSFVHVRGYLLWFLGITDDLCSSE